LAGFLPKMRSRNASGAAIRILRESFRAHATVGMANFVLVGPLHQFKTKTRFPRVP